MFDASLGYTLTPGSELAAWPCTTGSSHPPTTERGRRRLPVTTSPSASA